MRASVVSVPTFWALIIFFSSICKSGHIQKRAAFQQPSFFNSRFRLKNLHSGNGGFIEHQNTALLGYKLQEKYDLMNRMSTAVVDQGVPSSFQSLVLTENAGGGNGNGGKINSGFGGRDGADGEGRGEGGSTGNEAAGLMVLMMPLVLLLRRYSVLLESAPLLTKALSAACIGAMGDLICQIWENRTSTKLEDSSPKFYSRFSLDPKRTFAVIFDGVCVTGPGLHLAYGILEHLIPTTGGGALPALMHVCADTFMLDPLFVCSFFIMTGSFERKSLFKEILPQLKREYFSALHGSWAVSALFMPIQYTSFRYLPVQYRVLVVNTIDLAWTATMSFFSHKGPEEAIEHNVEGDGSRIIQQ